LDVGKHLEMTDEKLIRLDEAPAIVCELRPGSRLLHWSTIARWAKRGVRGVKLWSTPIGGLRYTSRSALREFLEQLAARDGQADHAPETIRQTTARLQRKADALADGGW
jgi:hypothetical protein